MFTITDPRSGEYLDNSANGVVLTKLARGELVRVTPRDNSFLTGVLGTATTSLPAQASSSSEMNEAGIAWQLQMAVPSGVGNLAYARFGVYGRVVGVRFRRDVSEPAVPINFAIDGRLYTPHDARLRYLNLSPDGSRVDGDSLVVVDDDLLDFPDGRPHTLDVILQSDLVGSTTYTTRIIGLLVEKRAGYAETPRQNWFVPPAAVPTSSTTIPIEWSSATQDKRLRGVRKIMYTNTSAGALTVTITSVDSGSTLAVWSKSIAAGDTAEFDPGANTMIVRGNWKHSASGAGLNFTVFGGW